MLEMMKEFKKGEKGRDEEQIETSSTGYKADHLRSD